MHYLKINPMDIANGTGVRVSLFVSGCRHHCPGCFNPESWDFEAGEEFDEEAIQTILKALSPRYIAGLTVLGGEPMEPENQPALLKLLRRVKENFPDKSVWLYSGFYYNAIIGGDSRASGETAESILSLCDVLVEGPFLQEQKNIALAFRGSENQCLIDLNQTSNDQTVLFEVESLRSF